MSYLYKALGPFLLATALLFMACSGDGDDGQDTQSSDVATDASSWTWPDPPDELLAFVTTVTGKVYVLDTKQGAVVNQVDAAPASIHGVAVMDGQRTIYVPTFDGVDKIEFAADMTSFEVTKSFALSKSPLVLAVSPDQKTIVTGSSEPAFWTAGEGDQFAVIISTDTDELVAELQFDSPARASFSPDSSHAYIIQQNSAEVPVVDLATATVTSTLVNKALEEGYPACEALAAAMTAEESCTPGAQDLEPDGCTLCRCQADNTWHCSLVTPGHGAVRASDGLLCISNLSRESLTCMNPDDPDNQWVIDTPGEFPHDLHFDPVTGYLWYQAMARIPIAADEAGNTEIPCAVAIYNVDAGAEVHRLEWDYGIWHVSLAPDNRAYASGSFHTVVVYDRQTYEKIEEVRDDLGPVGAPQPIMEIDF
jgi:hypothetical protein